MKEFTFDEVVRQRDYAIKMLADWCVAIDVNGGGWDDWDEYYKDARYRKTNLPEIREFLDLAIEKSTLEREKWN
jgi:hypothetical protein